MDNNPIQFDVTLPVTSSWTLLCVLQIGGGKSGALVDLLNTGGAALTHLKLTRSAIPSGHTNGVQIDWITDTGLDTPTAELLDIISPTSPPALYNLAAGAQGQFKLDRLQGVVEIGIWAKSSGTTVRVAGCAHGD